MQTVLLVIHLIVALALIGAVLLQRSEGGARWALAAAAEAAATCFRRGVLAMR